MQKVEGSPSPSSSSAAGESATPLIWSSRRFSPRSRRRASSDDSEASSLSSPVRKTQGLVP